MGREPLSTRAIGSVTPVNVCMCMFICMCICMYDVCVYICMCLGLKQADHIDDYFLCMCMCVYVCACMYAGGEPWGGGGGDGPPKNLRWGDRPCIGPPQYFEK